MSAEVISLLEEKLGRGLLLPPAGATEPYDYGMALEVENRGVDGWWSRLRWHGVWVEWGPL